MVDRLAELLNVKPTTVQRNAYIDYLNTYRTWGGVVSNSPFDGANADHISERVRGLLWILAQHPDYQVR